MVKHGQPPSPQEQMSMTQELLEKLYVIARRAGRLLILPHNDPDPDAIASAVALRYLLAKRLGLESTIAYQGIIGRAENKALLRYLDQPVVPLRDADLQESSCLALIDTQPGAGNITLPPGATCAVPSGAGRVVLVIDHHAWREETAMASFADVRPQLGATSTILTQYLQAAGVEPSSSLATALFYGIKTTTMGLSRDTSPADAAAYSFLQPRIEIAALAKIEHAQVPADYFRSFDAALRAARMYDGLILAYLAALSYPDLAAEIADVLLRLEKAQCVICMGVYQGALILSVRTRSQEHMAEKLVQAITAGEGSAGGHGTMAGGQIPLGASGAEQKALLVSRRALQHLGIPPEETGKPLI
jgi:nanoRNase/pAp phosphatase (c-di-AMP/oligoRNAs hydrolase)